jgi:hypothetical protein
VPSSCYEESSAKMIPVDELCSRASIMKVETQKNRSAVGPYSREETEGGKREKSRANENDLQGFVGRGRM